MGLESVSTDRVEEIRQSMQDVLQELLTSGSDAMEPYFETNTETVVDELYETMNALYQQVQVAQQQGKLGKIRYVRVFPRRVAVLEGTYSFTIRVYDEEGYSNPTEVSTEWNPDFLVRLFESQLKQIEKHVDTQIFRLTTREKQLVKQLFADGFAFLALMFLTILRTVFIFVENIANVDCAEKIALTFGNYLEQGNVIEEFDKPGGSQT